MMRRANPCARSEIAPSRRARRTAKVPRCRAVHRAPAHLKACAAHAFESPYGHVLAFRLAESSRCPCCIRFKDRVILEPPHIRSEVCTSRTAELRIGVCAACRAFEKHAARAAFRAVGYRCRHSQNRALPHDSRAVFRTAVPHFRTCRTASPELVRPCVRLRQSSLKYAQSRADKTGTARASCYRSNQSSPKVCSSLVSSLGG